jgi:hypothetical protein
MRTGVASQRSKAIAAKSGQAASIVGTAQRGRRTCHAFADLSSVSSA